jgi:phosphoglycerol transferase MdoB-like AlkP superfamily enzyme
VSWLAQALEVASWNYHFLSVLEFVSTLKFVGMIDLKNILSWWLLAFVASLAVIAVIAFSVTGRGPKSALAHLIVLVSLFVIDNINGSSHSTALARDHYIIPADIAGSPILTTAKFWMGSALHSRSPLVLHEDPKVYNAIDSAGYDGRGQSVLLVLVESMGEPKNTELKAWMVDQLLGKEIIRRWTADTGLERFRGTTTYGELRTLCGLVGAYSSLSASDAERCIPVKMLGHGYQTFALHGFDLRMFDRKTWWPKIGLRPWINVLGGSNSKVNCNISFPGICDSDVLYEAAKQADSPNRFVYALTLDTHLPLSNHRENPPVELSNICAKHKIDDASCRHLAGIGKVLYTLRRNLEQMKTPPLVAVVGDHAPPFLSDLSRSAFNERMVPYFILRPR